MISTKPTQSEQVSKEAKSDASDKTKKNKEIDLRGDTILLGQKTKKTYDLVDTEIRVVTLDNDLVVKLIGNNKGYFVDFRKYYKGYPTKKGIRMLATKFLEVSKVLKDDIIEHIPAAAPVGEHARGADGGPPLGSVPQVPPWVLVAHGAGGAVHSCRA